MTADVLTGKMLKLGMDLKSLVNSPRNGLRKASSLCPLQDTRVGAQGIFRL